MRDSQAIDAERRVQDSFRKSLLLPLLSLGAIVLLFESWMDGLPNRSELGPRLADLSFSPVAIRHEIAAGLIVAGAWEIESDDPRLGGVSALAVERDQLLALTDSGVFVRFAKPTHRSARALVRELPAGPGPGRYKRNRDSEALVGDPRGRGWWVAFENRNQLWLYYRAFRRPLRRVRMAADQWPRNRGIEAMSHDGAALLAVPEGGKRIVRIGTGSARGQPILRSRGRISDAARLPNGELWVVRRNLTVRGFSNVLAQLISDEEGYRYSREIPLPLSPLDNVEALAAEQLADGRIRLWLMTDDNYWGALRTLLLAVEMRPRRLP